MTLHMMFLVLFGLTLTTSTLGEKFACKQKKRPDGSLFFDCGHNIPKDYLRIQNTIVIWQTVAPAPPENAYLPPVSDNFRPTGNLVRVDAPVYSNVSSRILHPFLIKPILPETLKTTTKSPASKSKSVPENTTPAAVLDNIASPAVSKSTITSAPIKPPDVTEDISSPRVDSGDLDLDESSDKSEKSNPLKSSKIINPEKQIEIENSERAASINQPDHLGSSHAMQRAESANLISSSSDIDQQSSGKQSAWTGLATSIWFFYLYFFLAIFL